MIDRSFALVSGKRNLSSHSLAAFADRKSISSWTQYAVAGAAETGIIAGMDGGRFEPQQSATRAQACGTAGGTGRIVKSIREYILIKCFQSIGTLGEHQMKKSVTILFLAMIPSIVTMFLLVEFFPYTGLGRIVSIPATLFLNITFFILLLIFTRNFKSRSFKCLLWIAAILLSILLAVVLHPQEYLPSVITQLWELMVS
ncbi:S-layer homology domain-containing protein [Paenibacillus sp. NPDC056579]|uniref:S-layer homology domain-containing protein n=1 Tax=Paenibacillus sp. NPDC056579 TaxID=3345871 RepID=UPI00369ABE9B